MEVEVKVSDLLNRIVFVPRKSEDLPTVKKLLQESNPAVKIIRSAEGLSIKADDVGKLIIPSAGISFKWTELAGKFISNRKRIDEVNGRIITEIHKIRSGGADIAMTHLLGLPDLKVLDSHQIVNVACMTIKDSFGLCVFDEQGAGKTVTLIFTYDTLVDRDEVDFALIVSPKSMVSEWPVDFEKFTHGRYTVSTLVGTYNEKAATLASNSDVIVTNFETVISMEQELRAVFRRYGSRAILVVDESFFAKNLDAQRTQALRRLREFCGRAYVLCGTPAPNSPHDIIEQFNLVDFGATFNNVSVPKEKSEAAKVIKQVIEDRGPFVRHLKSDVLPGLPLKRFQRVILPLEPKQKQLYEHTVNNLVSDLSDTDQAGFEKNKMSFLARRSALLQICSSPKSIDASLDEVPSKTLALDQILDDLIGKKKEKVILWCFYTNTIDSMYKRYKKYNPVRYDGTITDTAERRESVRRFREDKITMLFIANPAAAGAGLNLQSARYAIYESMSNQAAHYLQSLDRIHRRGQTKDVEYIVLLSEDTIEIPEYDRLIQKEKSAQDMLGDTIVSTLTREGMLSELKLSR